jgi:hypothetical protein
MSIEAARSRLIEKYIIEAVDKQLNANDMRSYLNSRIRKHNGGWFDDENIIEYLTLFGFSEYQSWIEQQQAV